MILTILKNLISKPATRQYPFKDVRPPVVGFRGKIIFQPDRCKVCGACARRCPAKAQEVNRQARTYKYYPFNCIYCGLCVEGCPGKALVQDAHYVTAAFTKTFETFNIPAPKTPPPTPTKIFTVVDAVPADQNQPVAGDAKSQY
jgi:formate hydrogenlyase subunit 6/NADH:ubiquinone oxidoreductase subunit I